MSLTQRRTPHVTPRYVLMADPRSVGLPFVECTCLWPVSVQGHAPAGYVDSMRADVPGILIQHYLLFSLSQTPPPPNNQNHPEAFPFGKAASIVDVCQRLTSVPQSAWEKNLRQRRFP